MRELSVAQARSASRDEIADNAADDGGDKAGQDGEIPLVGEKAPKSKPDQSSDHRPDQENNQKICRGHALSPLLAAG